MEMAYEGGMGYQLHMPSYFGRTFTEYPYFNLSGKAIKMGIFAVGIVLTNPGCAQSR